ncbi:MAG: hypothetical protein ACYSUD_15390 [Planctomycetota bacterium]|jgi:hypothetical protein
MKPNRTIEKLLGQLRYKISPVEQDAIAAPIDQAWQRHEAEHRALSTSQPSGRMVGARSAKLAAAVAIALVGLIASVRILDRSTGPAYALEQTVEAVKNMRYFHFRLVGRKPQDVQREAWVEYDQAGELKNVRVSFFTQNSEMVWSDGITQYMNKDRNELNIFQDAEYTDKILFFANRHDPRNAIDYFRRREATGEVQIEIGEPAERSDPIPVTVTYEPNTYMIGTPMPRMQEVLHVDPATKLLSQTDVYSYAEGSFAHIGAWVYLDYNQSFERGIFDLESEVDAGTSRLSTLGLDLGIEQGKMSERETALKVASEFLTAWKSKEYDRALQIHGYATGSNRDNVLQMLTKSDLLQIVEIGKPSPAEPPMRGYTLHCTLQTKRGDMSDKSRWYIHVRRRTPTRWRIGKRSPKNSAE